MFLLRDSKDVLRMDIASETILTVYVSGGKISYELVDH